MCDYCRGLINSSTLSLFQEESGCKAGISYSNGVVTVTDENGDYVEWEVPYCPMCGTKMEADRMSPKQLEGEK